MSEQSSGASAPVAAPAAESQVSGEAASTEASSESAEESSSEESTSESIEASNEAKADEAKEVLEDPKATKKEKAAAKKTLKQLKIKVDGKEYLEDLPFEIPDDDNAKAYMTKQLQMSKASQKRMAESAALEKEVQAFVELLKKDPAKVLSDPNIGIDLNQFAAQIIENEIKNSKKTPEQIANEKLQAELKALREEKKRAEKEAKEREFQRVQQQEYERYDMQMSQALEKSDLPKSPYVVKKMADLLYLGLENGVDLSPQDVLPLVREEIQGDIKDMFAAMPDEVIEQLVGSEKINSIRKKKVAAAKAASQAQTATANQIKDTGSNAKKSEEPPKKISMKEFFKI